MNNINNFASTGELLDYQYQDHWIELASGEITEEVSKLYCKFYDNPCRKLLFWINTTTSGNQYFNLMGEVIPSHQGLASTTDYKYANMGSAHPVWYAGNKVYLAEYLEGVGWRIEGAGENDTKGNYETLGIKVTSPFNTPNNGMVKNGNQPAFAINFTNTSTTTKIGVGTKYKLYGVLEAPKQ